MTEKVETLDIEQPSQRSENNEGDEMTMLGTRNQEYWVISARRISYLSIAFTLAGGITGIVLSFVTESVSLLGYGLESFVDVWSSVLVLWRFWKEDVESNQKQTAFNAREQRASFGISFTFVLIGIFVGIQALIHISNKEKEEDAEVLLVISATSTAVLAVLAAIKFRIAKELNSPSLQKDGISSVAVAILSCGILVSTVVYDIDPGAWWLDDVVALLIAVFLIVYGIIFMYKHRKF